MPYVAKPKPSTFRCSAKQVEMMKHILEAADSGRFTWLGDLNGKISWGPVTKASLGPAVRHLEAHGFVKRLYAHGEETDISRMTGCDYGEQTKVRGMRMYIVPTPYAYSFFRPGKAS